MSDVARDPLYELERRVEADPGSPAFPALGEAYRRAGRYADAERVLRAGLALAPHSSAGCGVLALLLLERGRAGEAREALERVAGGLLAAAKLAVPPAPRVPPPVRATPLVFEGDVSEGELDDAFAGAETDVEQVVDADRVARDVLEREAPMAGAFEREEPAARELEREASVAEDLEPGSAFATRTMADLLERQGDARAAARIRAALAAGSPAPQPTAGPTPPSRRAGLSRDRVVESLERWLGNLRGSRT